MATYLKVEKTYRDKELGMWVIKLIETTITGFWFWKKSSAQKLMYGSEFGHVWHNLENGYRAHVWREDWLGKEFKAWEVRQKVGRKTVKFE